jgi:hypothetical protein
MCFRSAYFLKIGQIWKIPTLKIITGSMWLLSSSTTLNSQSFRKLSKIHKSFFELSHYIWELELSFNAFCELKANSKTYLWKFSIIAIFTNFIKVTANGIKTVLLRSRFRRKNSLFYTINAKAKCSANTKKNQKAYLTKLSLSFPDFFSFRLSWYSYGCTCTFRGSICME